MLPQIITPSLIPGVVGYSNMKLVYTCMCRTGFKNGELGSGPSLKMRGFQSGHSRENRGFSICLGRKSGTKNCTFLKRGSFGAAQVKKVESLGAVKAEKMGVEAVVRHIPVQSLYGSTLSPAPLSPGV